MSQKELLILVDCANLGSLDPSLLKRCDRLAMTPGAMATFDENSLSYITLEDLYDHKQFRKDNRDLIESVEALFLLLDRKYGPILDYPRSFTGNIYWFLVILAEIYYVLTICKKIERSYGKVHLVSNFDLREGFTVKLDFSPAGLMFTGLRVGLENKVKILDSYLSCEHVRLDNCQSSVNVNRHQLSHVLKRLPNKVSKEFVSFLAGLRKNKGIIYVIQDEYEVKPLKRGMDDYLFKKPLTGLLDIAREKRLEKRCAVRLGLEEVDAFAKKWFSGFEDRIARIFDLYHDNVLSYAGSFFELLRAEFDQDKPAALMYSIGAHTLYEDMAAHIANEKNIPIFYFQHGGATVYFQDPYNKYVENNENINKIYILQSQREKETLAKGGSGTTKALGSMVLYKAFKEHEGYDFAKRRRILYCTSVFNAVAYKALLSHVPDSVLTGIHKDIIETVNNLGLGLDIKVHPADEGHAHAYFTQILKSYCAKEINVLKGFFAEAILGNYGLLVLDILATAVAPLASVLDIPVILYQKDMSVLTEHTLSDIRKRFYLVENKEELERCMKLFSEGRLESKFSMEFVDKYAFPVGAGDPAVNISDYIRSKISETSNAETEK